MAGRLDLPTLVAAIRPRTINTSLVARITAHQGRADLVRIAGIPQAEFGTGLYISATTAGRSFVFVIPAQYCRQYGAISSITLQISQVGDASQRIKFKVFRLNGSNYDMVSETEQFTIPGTGVQTFTPATPLTCNYGDLIGLWVSGAASSANRVWITCKAYGNPTLVTLRYAETDVTTSDAFAATLMNYQPDIYLSGPPPYLAAAGDSINEGVSSPSSHHTFGHGGITTDTATFPLQPAHVLRTSIGDGSLLRYQNHAVGGTKWADQPALMAAITAAKPAVIFFNCGINDCTPSQTDWTTGILPHLNTIKAALGSEKLILAETLPCTGSSLAVAQAIRSLNANLASWCTSNGAYLVHTQHEMGQIRPATGEYDDIQPGLKVADGIHLSQTGVNALAALVLPYL